VIEGMLFALSLVAFLLLLIAVSRPLTVPSKELGIFSFRESLTDEGKNAKGGPKGARNA
jgi:hypothetical protein